MSWLERVKEGLRRTAGGVAESFALLGSRKLAAEQIKSIQDALIGADTGVEIAQMVASRLRQCKIGDAISEDEIKSLVLSIILPILEYRRGDIIPGAAPYVVMLCGVNGNGKTTTAGKLAHKWKREGKDVILAACDTFRAAAVDQLRIWAERAGSKFISGSSGADPASVAFAAVKDAQDSDADVVILDTAGRLQNKQNLMDELGKIKRTVTKLRDSGPDAVILVLDATTGQNAISQVVAFNEIVNLSGIIITKLDGTAKAGVVLQIAHRFQIPIVGIGIGEGIDDLGEFDPKTFAEGILGI